MPTEDKDEWISVPDAAALMGVSRVTVHNLIHAGRLVWRPKLNVPRSPREVLKSSALSLIPDSKKPGN